MLLLIFLFGSCIINALSRFISQQVQQIKLQLLVKEYSPLPRHEPSMGDPGNYSGQPLRQVTSPLSPTPIPHCQHEAARWVIAPLPNSNWVLVSEWGFVGSGNLRQMSEYPIPHGEHCIPASWEGVVNLHFCILKSRYRVWQICHRADEQHALMIATLLPALSSNKGQTNQFI
jgi:hypothetical protein